MFIFSCVININGFIKALKHEIIHQVLRSIEKVVLLMPILMTDVEISVSRDVNWSTLYHSLHLVKILIEKFCAPQKSRPFNRSASHFKNKVNKILPIKQKQTYPSY